MTLPLAFEDRHFYTDYPEEIVSTLFEREVSNLSIKMLSDQIQHIRPMLIELFHSFAKNYRFSVQTVHLGVHILDCYMDSYILSEYEDHQKLTGLVCLMLAAKSEDLDENVPSIKDLLQIVNLTDDLGLDLRFKEEFTPQEVSLAYKQFSRLYAQLEFLVFECMEFNTIRPTAATFISMFQSAIVNEQDVMDVKICEDEQKISLGNLQASASIYIAQFLDLVISITDFVNTQPSKLAAAIIGAVRKLLKIKNYWNDELSTLLNQSVHDIRPLLIVLLEMRMSIVYGLQSQTQDEDCVMVESGYASEPSPSTSIGSETQSPQEKKRKLGNYSKRHQGQQ